MEEEIKKLRDEVHRLEKVVLTNKGMILYICHGLKMTDEQIDMLEKRCEEHVERALKEYEEETKAEK